MKDYATRLREYESEKRRLPKDLSAEEYEAAIKKLINKHKI